MCHQLEDFDTMEQLQQHEFSEHKKYKCEKCPRKFTTMKGLKIHIAAKHSNISTTMKSKIKLAKQIKMKYLKIKESFNFDVRKVYNIYKTKQNEKSFSPTFKNFFKCEPINPPIIFNSFDKKYSSKPYETEKKIIEMIFSPELDTIAMWHSFLKMFNKDIKKYASQKSFDVKQFDLKNTSQKNYQTQVHIYRQLSNECFTKIVDLLE